MAFVSYSHAKDKPIATALQSVVQTRACVLESYASRSRRHNWPHEACDGAVGLWNLETGQLDIWITGADMARNLRGTKPGRRIDTLIVVRRGRDRQITGHQSRERHAHEQ